VTDQPSGPEQPDQRDQPSPQWGQPGDQWQQPGPQWGQPGDQWQQPGQQWQQPGQQWQQPGQQWGQPGQPAAYGPPGHPPYGPYGAPPVTTSSKATSVLVLGIVSLVMMLTCGLGFVTAVIALVLAPGAKREIAGSGGRLTGESQVRTGTILAWVTLGLTALAVVVLAVVIGVAISVDDGASSPSTPTVVTPG
jgi:hypothetical protein